MRDSLSLPNPRSDGEILKSALGMNLDQVDADFVKWFGEERASRWHDAFSDTFSDAPSVGNTPPPRSSTECDDRLWNRTPYSHHTEANAPGAPELAVKDKCIAVTGTILDATNGTEQDGVRRERNGNGRGWLKPDHEFKNLLNQGNLSNEGGNLVFQIICQYSSEPQEDHNFSCSYYKSPIKVPPIGTHVRVVGVYVRHMNQEAWMEIDPVTSITVIQ